MHSKVTVGLIRHVYLGTHTPIYVKYFNRASHALLVYTMINLIFFTAVPRQPNILPAKPDQTFNPRRDGGGDVWTPCGFSNDVKII